MTIREVWRDGQLIESESLPPLPEPEPDPVAQVLAVLAALTPEQLQRVVTLGVAVTEPAAVDTLEQAVLNDDPTSGVHVLADAAAAAQAAVEGE